MALCQSRGARVAGDRTGGVGPDELSITQFVDKQGEQLVLRADTQFSE